MNRMRKMPHMVVMVLGLLLLTGPAHAGGWPAAFAPATVFERALNWWQGLWAAGAHDGALPAAQPGSLREKSDSGTIPPPAGTSTTPVCQGSCDKGGGIDPEG